MLDDAPGVGSLPMVSVTVDVADTVGSTFIGCCASPGLDVHAGNVVAALQGNVRQPCFSPQMISKPAVGFTPG